MTMYMNGPVTQPLQAVPVRHEEPERATRRSWIALAVLMLPVLVITLDNTVLSFAVPQLTQALHPSSTQLLWIIDVYPLCLAGLLVTMGMLGDRLGRRRMLLIGTAGFALVGIYAAFAPSAGHLIAARADIPCLFGHLIGQFTSPVFLSCRAISTSRAALWPDFTMISASVWPSTSAASTPRSHTPSGPPATASPTECASPPSDCCATSGARPAGSTAFPRRTPDERPRPGLPVRLDRQTPVRPVEGGRQPASAPGWRVLPRRPGRAAEHRPAQQTRNARLALELDRATRLPDGCAALTGTCDCTWCVAAACDRGAPLDLGDGAWVLVRGVRKWVAAS